MNKQVKYNYTQIKTFRTDEAQMNTLYKLKTVYNIDISNFIRLAIKEKIKRDYPKLKEQLEDDKFPWS